MSRSSQLLFPAPLEKAGLLILLAALSGCDVPTDVPIFDVRWVFPIEGTRISVVELLPTNVIIAGGNFEATPDVVLSQTLGSLCTVCVGSGGVPVPKPAFLQTFNQTGSLPTDVVSAVLVGGSISLAIQNDLGFDPINPATAPPAPGTFTVTLYDTDITGPQLGQVILDGANGDAIPAGPSTIPITLTTGTVSSTIFAEVSLDSPAGDAVPIDVAAGFTVTVGTVSVSSATLLVDGLSVDLDPTNLDVGGIDTSIPDRILMGSLILDIQNPFDVGVTLDLDISGLGFQTISKINITISNGATSSVTVTYTADELRRFLGQADVLVSGVGTVVGGPAPSRSGCHCRTFRAVPSRRERRSNTPLDTSWSRAATTGLV